MKKKIVIISIVLIVFGIICFGFYQNDSIRFKISYEYINSMEYSNGKKISISIPWDNRIKYIEAEDILELLENGTGIIYFGYNTCPWCRNTVPVLIDVAKKNDIDTIYYADIHDSNFSSIKKELFELLNDYLREDDEGDKVLAVPDVYFVSNGNVIGHHIGTVDSYKNPYLGMNVKQKDELFSIYQNYIKEMDL